MKHTILSLIAITIINQNTWSMSNFTVDYFTIEGKGKISVSDISGGERLEFYSKKNGGVKISEGMSGKDGSYTLNCNGLVPAMVLAGKYVQLRNESLFNILSTSTSSASDGRTFKLKILPESMKNGLIKVITTSLDGVKSSETSFSIGHLNDIYELEYPIPRIEVDLNLTYEILDSTGRVIYTSNPLFFDYEPIYIYPTLTNSAIQVELAKGLKRESLSIWNLDGLRIKTLAGNSEIRKIEVGFLSPGIYFIGFTNDIAEPPKKFIKY